MKRLTERLIVLLTMAVLTVGVSSQTTEITYQGQLRSSSMAANGSFDFEFVLFDSVGSQIGPVLTRSGVAVTDGIFSVNLNFGPNFPGANRFLEIRVRQSGGGAYTTLTPRQPVTSSPYSVKSLTADTAANATNASSLGGVAANEYLQANGNGSGLTSLNAASVTTGTLSNARLGQIPTANLADSAITSPKIAAGQVVKSLNALTDNVTLTAGSNITITPTGNTLTIASTGGGGNAILNQTAVQPGANFNISGNGTAGVINAVTQYNIGGNRVLSVTASGNVIAGLGAGAANTSGSSNSFFGNAAGNANTTGGANSFFGSSAGFSNVNGAFNAFFGGSSGLANTAGVFNSFFGHNAGSSNTTGSTNSFFGQAAGLANTTGSDNSFFGMSAGLSNTTASNNAFFGHSAGSSNTTGARNSLFGSSAGLANTTGANNSFFGFFAGQANTTAANNSFFGRSSGFSTTTGGDNSFFGSDAGRDNTTGFDNSFFGSFTGVTNTTGAQNSFYGTSAGVSNTTGGSNSYFGSRTGQSNDIGGSNSFFGTDAGLFNRSSFNSFFGFSAGRGTQSGGDNAFFGVNAGFFNISGSNNSFFGTNTGNNNSAGSNNTLIGDNANVASGALDHATAIGAGTIVSASNRIQIGRGALDTVAIGAFGTPTASTPVCINSNSVFTSCTASSSRYKESISPLRLGLKVIQSLRPVTFNWTDGHQNDLGLVAEEVAAVDPLLATYNKVGDVEGVKYTQLNVVLINAVKEQQEQIEILQKMNAALGSRLFTVERKLRKQERLLRRK